MKPLDPRLVRRSRAVRRHLALAVVLGTAAAVLIVVQAWLVSVEVADGFDSAGQTDTIGLAVLGIVGCFVARALIGWGHRVAAARAAAAVKSRLRRDIVDSLLGDRPVVAQSGHVIALVGRGLDALDGYFARYLPQLVLALAVPAVVGAALLWADLLAAVTVLLTLPLIVVFMALVGWLTRVRTERRWAALKRLTHHFADVLDGLTVLKVFGRSERQVEGLSAVGERHRRETLGALRLAFLSSFVLELCATISVALVAVGVGLRVLDGSLSLQIGLFVLLLAPEAFLPVRQVGVHFHDSAEGAEAARDAFALLDSAPPPPARPVLDRSPADPNLLDRSPADPNLLERSPADPNLLERRLTDPNEYGGLGPLVEAHGLRVRYPDRDSDALPPTDLVVEPGEVVAIAGPSGCGKSTLLGALLGFVEPATGRVAVDGVQVVDPHALRNRIAWVPQHPRLIAGTIADNVRLATPATDTEVRAALDTAAAGSLAIDRRVTERGANLSAGERRRVAVARALLRVRSTDADLLLLDEPTAGLDAEAEATVIAAIRAARISTLVVAHRPALIAAADRVVSVGRQVAPV